jgi:hypothetical protein
MMMVVMTMMLVMMTVMIMVSVYCPPLLLHILLSWHIPGFAHTHTHTHSHTHTHTHTHTLTLTHRCTTADIRKLYEN